MNAVYRAAGALVLLTILAWIAGLFLWPFMIYPALILTALAAMSALWEIWLILDRGISIRR